MASATSRVTSTLPPRVRVYLVVSRVVTTVLRATGQRERVLDWRRERARRRRLEVGRDHPLASPALHGMDRALDAIIDRDGGFFVEAGANDGYCQSNTYWLERFRGWRGILVEPMPELHARCRRERPGATVVQAALVPEGHPEPTIRMRFADLMTTVSAAEADPARTALGTAGGWVDPYEADVPARTLSSILDEHDAPEIDLLSLDVEGYETAVLAGLDLERHAPRYVLVEVHDEEAGRPPLESALGDRYTFDRRLSPIDLLYRRCR